MYAYINVNDDDNDDDFDDYEYYNNYDITKFSQLSSWSKKYIQRKDYKDTIDEKYKKKNNVQRIYTELLRTTQNVYVRS